LREIDSPSGNRPHWCLDTVTGTRFAFVCSLHISTVAVFSLAASSRFNKFNTHSSADWIQFVYTKTRLFLYTPIEWKI